jgi:MFS family permease
MSRSTRHNAALPLLSGRATTLYAAVAAISFSAASSAPTPLYHLYQQSMGLSPAMITVIFAAYSFALLGALLTVASLSDHLGRRPMILVALLLNAVALLVFILAQSAVALIAARLVQGVATGIALTTLGATILDSDRANGAMYNSLTAFLGLMVGSLLAGALVAFAPLPSQLVYIVLLVVTLVEAVLLIVLPETTSRRPGALASLRPHAAVPPAARATALRLLPLNIAGWALGAFYLSLMPTLVSVSTGIASPFVGATVVSVLMLAAATGVLVLRHVPVDRLLVIAMAMFALGIAITLGGAGQHSMALLFAGTAVAGFGFGNVYAGNLRALLPLAGAHERAGLLAAYFIGSYLAFSLPAILAGLLAPVLGLMTTAYLYGAVLIAFTAISYAATRPRREPAMRLG